MAKATIRSMIDEIMHVSGYIWITGTQYIQTKYGIYMIHANLKEDKVGRKHSSLLMFSFVEFCLAILSGLVHGKCLVIIVRVSGYNSSAQLAGFCCIIHDYGMH